MTSKQPRHIFDYACVTLHNMRMFRPTQNCTRKGSLGFGTKDSMPREPFVIRNPGSRRHGRNPKKSRPCFVTKSVRFGCTELLFKRSAHSAGPMSFSPQCCLRIAVSVELLARWLLLRFPFLSVGSFGWSFFALGRCLLGSFGAFWAALGGFFWVSEAPLGSREGPLGSL